MAIRHGNHHYLLVHHRRCKRMDYQVLQYLYHLAQARLLKAMVVDNLPGLKMAEVDKLAGALVVSGAAEVDVVGMVEEEANKCLPNFRGWSSSLSTLCRYIWTREVNDLAYRRILLSSVTVSSGALLIGRSRCCLPICYTSVRNKLNFHLCCVGMHG